MGRTKKKETFRQSGKRKLYSTSIKKKMKELREKGHSRQKTCEILNIPLVEEWSWYKYTNSKKVYDEKLSESCTFNRPFNFIRNPIREQFEKEVVQLFRNKSKSRGFPQTILGLCCHEIMKSEVFRNDVYLNTLKFTQRFTTRLMVNHGLVRTNRKSSAKFFTEHELNEMRAGMEVKLQGYKAGELINTDETGLFINISNTFAIRHRDDKFFDEENNKLRITFLPYVNCVEDLKIPPAVIGHSLATTWQLSKRKEEKLKVRLPDGSTAELRRFHCEFEGYKFVLYKNSSAWMYQSIWLAEMSRLSQHLKKIKPQKKYGLICDNFRGHCQYKSSNLETIFLPPCTTSRLQPLDTAIFGVYKMIYRKELNQIVFGLTDDVKKKSLSEEQGTKLALQVWAKNDILKERYEMLL